MHSLLNWSVYFVYYKTVLDTHQMRLVIVLFICVWYANFIETEDPIVVFIMIVVWKF